jgi:CheY-like chemotaxis protein
VRELVQLQVTDARGRTLFQSDSVTRWALDDSAAIGEDFGGMHVRAQIRESMADQLVIGGLPRSRLPFLLALLAVAAALSFVAIGQIRREGELSRLRADFVASISHELRTPLTQMRLYLETLRLGRFTTDEQREWSLDNVERETTRLGHLVERVLRFSRTGRASPDPRTPVDVRAELEQLVAEFAPLADARGAHVVADLDAVPRVALQPDALRHIVLNLLDNAVKYGPRGQTVRWARGCRGRGSRGAAACGSRSRTKGRAFRRPTASGSGGRISAAGTSAASRERGRALGGARRRRAARRPRVGGDDAAGARGALRRHAAGVRATIESPPNRVLRGSGRTRAPAHPRTRASMMGRILVVEDNSALAEGLAYNLRHEGHDVRIAEDGESGLADARAWEPDLVILDLMLPRLDGYGVLAAIREDRNDVPVIILSARGEEADKVRGFRLDADQYVTKPFGVLELLERVRSLLRRASSRAAAPSADELPLRRRRGGRRRAFGDARPASRPRSRPRRSICSSRSWRAVGASPRGRSC